MTKTVQLKAASKKVASKKATAKKATAKKATAKKATAKKATAKKATAKKATAKKATAKKASAKKASAKKASAKKASAEKASATKAAQSATTSASRQVGEAAQRSLFDAIERGDLDALAVALGRGVSPNPRVARDGEQIAALELATRQGRGAAAQLLLCAGANPYELDAAGRTLLHRAPDAPTARALIARGVDVAVADAEGSTALHLACVAGDAERVRLLIAAGADVESKTMAGLRPFLLATTEETRQALVEAGATDLSCARGEPIAPTRELVGPADVAGLAPGCLGVDGEGVRWFGGEAGVFRYDDASLERFTFPSELRVVAWAAGTGSSVFFATDRGLLETTSAATEWRLHDTTNSGLFDSDLIAIACDADGKVHVLGRADDDAQKPISTYDGERWGVLQPGVELPSEGQTRGLGFDAGGGLLLLLDDGFAYRGEEAWMIERSIGTGGVLAPTIHQAVGRGSSTFFVTSLGLFRYRRGKFDRYETPHPPQVICFAGDYLYIGMVEGGLAELTLGSKELRVFDAASSALPSDNITGLAVDHGGTLWIQADRDDLLLLSDGELRPL